MHIQYSGPDNTVHRSPTDGATLEWYQPPTEPGNLFSYPGSLGLLEAGTAQSVDLLTSPDTAWESQSNESLSIDWSMEGGSNVSSGSVSTHSFDTSVTMSGKATV